MAKFVVDAVVGGGKTVMGRGSSHLVRSGSQHSREVLQPFLKAHWMKDVLKTTTPLCTVDRARYYSTDTSSEKVLSYVKEEVLQEVTKMKIQQQRRVQVSPHRTQVRSAVVPVVNPVVVAPKEEDPLEFTLLDWRDSPQSNQAGVLWLKHKLEVAPHMVELAKHAKAKGGKIVLEDGGGMIPDACFRTMGEDYWESKRRIVEATPGVTHQFLFRGQAGVGYRPFADDVIEKAIELYAKNYGAWDGVEVEGKVFDALNYLPNMHTAINAMKKNGIIPVGTICYTNSPYHSPEQLVELGSELIETHELEQFFLKDMAGLMGPMQSRFIVSHLRQRYPGLHIAVQSHTTAGLADMTLFAAVEAGADRVDVATSSFAGGPGHTALESMMAAFRGTPRDSKIDPSVVAPIAAYWRETLPHYKKYQTLTLGSGIDARILDNQVPGGAISTQIKMLDSISRLDALPAILDNIPGTRGSLGYVPLVTPTALHVMQQSASNILSGEWQSILPDTQIIAIGGYGKTPGPVDPELQEKVFRLRLETQWKESGLEAKATEQFDHLREQEAVIISLQEQIAEKEPALEKRLLAESPVLQKQQQRIASLEEEAQAEKEKLARSGKVVSQRLLELEDSAQEEVSKLPSMVEREKAKPSQELSSDTQELLNERKAQLSQQAKLQKQLSADVEATKEEIFSELIEEGRKVVSMLQEGQLSTDDYVSILKGSTDTLLPEGLLQGTQSRVMDEDSCRELLSVGTEIKCRPADLLDPELGKATEELLALASDPKTGFEIRDLDEDVLTYVLFGKDPGLTYLRNRHDPYRFPASDINPSLAEKKATHDGTVVAASFLSQDAIMYALSKTSWEAGELEDVIGKGLMEQIIQKEVDLKQGRRGGTPVLELYKDALEKIRPHVATFEEAGSPEAHDAIVSGLHDLQKYAKEAAQEIIDEQKKEKTTSLVA